MTKDIAYFTRRAREEHEAASAAVHRQARLSHLELAHAYEYRVHLLLAAEKRTAMHLVEAA